MAAEGWKAEALHVLWEDTDDVCSSPGKGQENQGKVISQALAGHSATKYIQEITVGLIIHLEVSGPAWDSLFPHLLLLAEFVA